MFIWKKHVLLTGLFFIVMAGTSRVDAAPERATRGIQLESAIPKGPKESSKIQNNLSTEITENEILERIKSFRAIPFHMMDYEKIVRSTGLYHALNRCRNCSTETIFAGYGDVIATYIIFGGKYNKSGGSAEDVLQEGVGRIVRLQKSGDVKSSTSPLTASQMILRLLKLLPPDAQIGIESSYDAYVEMARKSGLPEAEGQALGQYLVWSIRNGHSERSLALFERLLALPPKAQIIPLKMRYMPSGELNAHTEPEWADLIKAITYAQGGQYQKAEIYFAEYRQARDFKSNSKDADVIWAYLRSRGEYLRGETLYFEAIGKKGKPPIGGREAAIDTTADYQVDSRNVALAGSMNLDADLDAYWWDPKCNGTNGVQSYLCSVDRAFASVNGPAYAKDKKPDRRFHICELRFSDIYAMALRGLTKENLGVYETSMKSFALASESQTSGDCSKKTDRANLRSLTSQENFNEFGDGDKTLPSRTLPGLAEDEVFIQFHAGEKHVYIWLATSEAIQWKRVNIDREILRGMISQLRVPLTFKQEMPFDRIAAWQLYQLLFSEIEEFVSGKERVYILVNEPLNALPFNLLIKRDPAALDYRHTNWLVRDHAVTIFTSFDALIRSRIDQRLKRDGPPNLIAYYDPVFNIPDTQGGDAKIIPLQETGEAEANLDGTRLFSSLETLPGTSSEISLIKSHFDTDAVKLISGLDASETDLKTRDLSQYSIVYFATHGLTGLQLEPYTVGKVEPGIALVNPRNPTLLDDGALQQTEIYRLKLDADLVVLSGCNTGSDTGGGRDAVSGLAEAFLTAGARSVIATHWEISDHESVRLMGGMFDRAFGTFSAGTSDALRQSILSYIDTLPDDSLAHPRYWAPFFVINAMTARNADNDLEDWKRATELACSGKESCSPGHRTRKLSCAVPSSPTEAMICSDAKLVALHRKLFRLFSAAWWNDYRQSKMDQWVFGKQDQCRTKKCLFTQYLSQVEAIRDYLDRFEPGKGYFLEGRTNIGDWNIMALHVGWSSDAVDLAKCEETAELWRGKPAPTDGQLDAEVIFEYRCVSRRVN
jgi:CHAT domain-containing protein